ncbi:MAG TPA: hypothetical protein DDY78_01905, partial [Planctomycetales bacterium]|nr:hypothetical protein [Planctomycetales bacterium]
PHGRVQRVNVFSIFFLMHLLISTAGGLSTFLFAQQMLRLYRVTEGEMLYAILSGSGVAVLLVVLYISMVWYTT